MVFMDVENEKNKYDKIGFKCGLEIHLQLNTDKKLFCNCPNRRSRDFPITIARKIRPSAGELGKMDAAALQEFLRERKFSYLINPETSCLVEADEEPPREINRDALMVALSIAKALNCAIPDYIFVMRKVVADGSAVSGFQRTALIGMNGRMETKSGGVRIASLSLEEDSAAPAGEGAAYRLDRLGVPLIEIGTEADIKNPEQAKQAAEHIGTMLLGNRLRGIGAIRQDINVSIKGGARVEIKGMQELGAIEAVIENEIRRQQDLIKIKHELEKRKSLAPAMKDVTKLLINTQSNLMQKAIKDGGTVFAGILKGFAGLMARDCGGKTFGKELSSYAGVFGLGIIHSDEAGKFPFLADDFAKLRKEFSAGGGDLVFIVAGGNAETACEAVLKRAGQSIKCVPEETRAANPDGTSSYLRPLPGAARMYPETDVTAIKITAELLKKTKPPKSAGERLRLLEKILPKQMAGQMLKSEYLGLFEKLSARPREYNPVFVANILLSVMKDLKRKGVPVENISEDVIERMFSAEKSKIISKDFFTDIMIMEALSKGTPFEEVMKIKKVTEGELRSIVKDALARNPHLAREKKVSAVMGEVMKEVRGKMEGEKVLKIVKEEIEKCVTE